MSIPPSQLSCEQCRQRKTKCSKDVPCSACLKADIACTAVQRHRLPRGRSVRKVTSNPAGSALKDRVQRLEALVLELQSQQASSSVLGQDPPAVPIAPSVDSFLASDFWTQLSTAVDGLKDVLERDDALDDVDETRHVAVGPHSLLWGSDSRSTTINDMSPELRDWLLNLYAERVDCLFKPIHWPAALKTIDAVKAGQLRQGDRLDGKALERAIYFTSGCSLLDYEFEGRHALVDRLREAAEEALTEAGLLTTTSLTVLQAFVIYLAGLRACQSNAEQWSLTALAIRLANAVGIPSRASGAISSIDCEIHRRVWHCIGVLDLQSSFDRGSKPLLTSDDLMAFPLDINDSDLGKPASTDQHKWTDMSLSLVTYHAGVCQRRLTEIGIKATMNKTGDSLDANTAREAQIKTLEEFEYYLRQLVKNWGPTPSLLQEYTLAVGEESLVAMSLLVRRPLHLRSDQRQAPPDDASFNVLQTATEVLERSNLKRTQHAFAPWAWFQWVKWYALAVVLAELCCPISGPLIDRAWVMAQLSYEDYAKDVADTKTGLLWRPISRLMRKARQVQAPNVVPHQPRLQENTSTMEHETVIDHERTSPLNRRDELQFFETHMSADPYDADMMWDMFINDFNDPSTVDS